MATARPASLARRALPALAIAGVSGGLLVKLDQPGTAAQAAASRTAPGSRPTAAGSTPTTRADAPAARTTTPTTSATRPTPATRPTAAPPTAAGRAAAPTTVPAAPAAAGGACTGAPVDGPAVNTRFGPVQVAASFAADGTLCEVQTLVSPNDRRKSVSINQYALPILRTEALAAKSAAIDVVSGATITSDAYATSLQSILDGRG